MTARRSLFAALAVVVAMAAAYSAYWFHVAGELRKGLATWGDQRRAAGWQVDYAELAVRGFPGRIAAIFTEPSLAIPGGVAWRADMVSLSAVPFDLRHLHAEIPGTQQLALGRQTVMVSSPDFHAEVVLGSAGQLEEAHLAGTAVELTAGEAALLRLAAFAASGLPLTAADPADYRAASLSFVLTVADVQLPEGLPVILDRRLAMAEVGGRVLGTIPPGPLPAALAAWSEGGGTIELDRLAVEWPPVGLEGDGTLALDSDLQPQAAISARVRGYGELVDRLGDAGILDPGAGMAAKMLLTLMSKPDSRGRPAIALPITVQDGRLWLGPQPVAEVPSIPWSGTW